MRLSGGAWPLLVLAACKTPASVPIDGGPADVAVVDPEATPSIATGCAEWSKAACAAAARCQKETLAVQFADVPTCERERERVCLQDQIPASGVTNEILHACSERVRTNTTCVLDFTCPAPGHRTIGQGCSASSQCASTNCYYGYSKDECGKCKEADRELHRPPSPGPGERCSKDIECRVGSTCIKDVCNVVSPRTVGQSCTQDAWSYSSAGALPCAGGLECVGKKDAGACVARPADGAPCKEDGPHCIYPSSCIAGVCKSDRACVPRKISHIAMSAQSRSRCPPNQDAPSS